MRRSEAGFTLIELAVAVGILAIAGLGLASAVSLGVKGNALARERTTALNAAETQLQNLLALTGDTPGDLLAHTNGKFDVATLERIDPNVPVGSINVDPRANPLLTVEVAVCWRGALGPDEVVVTTMVMESP